MSTEIKVPPLGESITEATVAGWRVQPGDQVASGDIVVELETDKITMEVPAPTDGVIESIVAEEGATVTIDQLLATIKEGAAATPAKADAESEAAPAAAAADSGAPRNETVPPGAARLAKESGIDPATVEGSGKRGQVRKADIVAAIDKGGTKPVAGATKSAVSASTTAPSPQAPRTPGCREERLVPMSRLRQKIAERLVESQQTAAILTTFNEIDMANIMAIRSRYKDQFKEKHGVSLGFMSIFVKAVVTALQEIPAINAEIRGTDTIYKDYCDIGVAVGGPRGLVVPIIRNAESLSFAEIEAEIGRLAVRVRDGSITIDELQGGSFTISNGGVYGSLLSTPIINPPQSGILGMHNIVRRPIAVGDEVVIRPMMYIALSYDHRIVDGKDAVTFLVRIKELVENPERLLLEV